MEKGSFSPEEKAAITDLIRRAEPFKNAMVFGQAVVEVSKSFNVNPIPQMEKILREMNSDIYLLAAPLTNEVDNYTSRMPHSGDKEYPYYLWVCVNGEDEAMEMMERIETDQEQNLSDLSETGMLVPKPNSDASKAIHARLN